MALSSLASEVLLDGPDQTITGHWQIGTLAAQRLTTRTHNPPGSLNGVQTKGECATELFPITKTGLNTYWVSEDFLADFRLS